VLRIASRIDQQLMIYEGTGAPVSRSEPNTLVHSSNGRLEVTKQITEELCTKG
jgi:hypothetical protein